MFEVLARCLASGLELWVHKEKTKYIDELIALRKEYYEESNKDPSVRDDAVLDNLEFKLRVLAIAFSSGASKQNATNQP